MVFRPAQPAAASQGDCAFRTDTLKLPEVRADARAVYLDVVHEDAAGPSPWPLPSQAPEVFLRVDGCLVDPPPLKGAVFRDSARYGAPGTIEIALDALPDGDLDLALRAFGVTTQVALFKAGSGVRSLRDEQRKGFKLFPADPEHHISASVAIVYPDCPGAPREVSP